MVTTVVDAVFIDSNILIYASILESPFHLTALNKIQAQEQVGRELWISRQVLREYLATLTRPQTTINPIPILTLTTEIRFFENRFRVAEDNPQVTQNLLTLVEQVAVAGRQIHDANIVATMQAYNITKLLTHNLADFNRFAHLITLLPLQE
ncbi:type II toxin-antitoxin system VapC family toxin [Iningainema tapete]|uniref:Type II toxin-antitoxin system VapC family toxin n=1 Tax=Iningainema tapete BLCC-T55 TaxID=2748662 RepID=A0A8J6XH02_9CYAN|nr:type II toxin-antitoxin system VapC family toxin [Iningainema tapete]MBD2773110.1 type II toxin-antitoxin system VapC family toxin [Iningainema tapete BLCC-T55]